MKGDFTRDTFDPGKHFSRVLQQQGRVQLDADTNEQTAILLHYLRTLAADLIGPFAGPELVTGGPIGFSIALDNSFNISKPNFTIAKGRYYVDGILCENEQDTHYLSQDNYPNPIPPAEGSDYLVYLDVWERHISYIENDAIREVALGGPDTTSRAQVIWQVKLFPVDVGKLLNDGQFQAGAWQELVNQWQPQSGCLKARLQPAPVTSPCIAAPDARYRGLENHLYRIEVHQSGTAGKATFKWSHDNGAIASAIVDGSFTNTGCTVESTRGFTVQSWVELSNDEQELHGEPGALVLLTNITNNQLTFAAVDLKFTPTKVRKWDQVASKTITLTDGAISIAEAHTNSAGWIDLEDGLQIQFRDQDSNVYYRSGDYWLIPARVATGDIEWPVTMSNGHVSRDPEGNAIPLSRPAFGIRHHYAPLALISGANEQNPLTSLQTTFRPIPKLNGADFDSQGDAGYGSFQTPCTLNSD